MNIDHTLFRTRMDEVRTATKRHCEGYVLVLDDLLYPVILVLQMDPTREGLTAALDDAQERATADRNPRRGQYCLERLCDLREVLLTDKERAELNDLAARLAEDMAANLGGPDPTADPHEIRMALMATILEA
jgi:hypothetical protein